MLITAAGYAELEQTLQSSEVVRRLHQSCKRARSGLQSAMQWASVPTLLLQRELLFWQSQRASVKRQPACESPSCRLSSLLFSFGRLLHSS